MVDSPRACAPYHASKRAERTISNRLAGSLPVSDDQLADGGYIRVFQDILYASTSGTDADWVVKLIDVYPDEVPADPELGGYQLGIAMDIFRGRYRESLERPTAIPANTVQRYRFALPTIDHVFLPGHRIMVQVQSSWFPLYDRNPQTFVDNIFFAKPTDYRKATQRVYHQPGAATTIDLPIAP